ncbi:hypothetical protein TPENAI_60769 [Tenacibaculum litopenaei]|uniref:hypothetical protein n=1 Tax=Tenacibaculum litopenaei TaxID=396016 RepID=UPI0038961DFC
MAHYNEYGQPVGPMQQGYYQSQRQSFQGQSPRWNKQRKKKSSAKLHASYGSDSGVFIHGFKVMNGKRWSYKIFRSEKQQKNAPVTSKAGKRWVSVTIVMSSAGENDRVNYGMLNIDNHKAYFSNWNWICNPHANNGGYIGKHISTKR